MIILVLVLSVVLYFAWVPFRLLVTHPISTIKGFIVDFYRYVCYKGFNNCPTGNLVAYCGLFGKGKTLTVVHKICSLYRRYHDKLVYDREMKCFVTQKIRILSNVELRGIPYIKFVSMSQIVEFAEQHLEYDKEHKTRTVLLVLGDEFSTQMNSRNFKNNLDPLVLNTILTCRHHYISIYYTAQRFQHVDALLRQVTSYVVDCRKTWRFQIEYLYDAWEMENATSASILKPIKRTGFFVRDRDYNAYNTLACVDNLIRDYMAGNMLTEEEILNLQQNQGVQLDGVQHLSRRFLRSRKKLNKT